MKANPVQFAVVREDPWIDAELVRKSGAKRILMVGSGGCTALSLQAILPELEITLLDPNAAQLALIQSKVQALRNSESLTDLSQCGNFESLFRGLREFIYEFVADKEEWESAFKSPAKLHSLVKSCVQSKYWPVAFELYFSDALLNAVFGPDATQHAPRGSYPAYFQAAFERGLRASDGGQNYFLHHVFLGRYLEGSLPPFMTLPTPREHRFEYVHGKLDQIENLAQYDWIGLSNIFDWMPDEQISLTAQLLKEKMRRGASIAYRQLNHTKSFETLFEPAFEFDTALGESLLARDRSLFYSKINVGTKCL